MMKIKIITFFIIVSGLFMAADLSAQKLPAMASDPAVKSGKLPNGMTYYVAVNASSKGHADFALVQKTGTETVQDSLSGHPVVLAKDALAYLPRIKAASPQEWLARHGVITSHEGYVNVSDDATVFRFHDVSFGSGKNVLDSTLLLLMTITDRISDTEDPFLRKWYSPSDQAIIIAGDVNAADVVAKLSSLSYMTPSFPSHPRGKYQWVESDTAVFDLRVVPGRKMADVSMSWRIPRAPVEYMTTVQPAIYERFVNVLGYIAERRVMQDLTRRGVPYADVAYRHRSSASGSGDEMFSLTVSLPETYAQTAVGSIARTFAALDAKGAEMGEYRVARNQYLDRLEDLAGKSFKDNSEYVDRCISAFMTNASLASAKEKLALHNSRQLSDSTQLRLFHDMATALIDKSRNMILTCVTGRTELEKDKLANTLYAAWSDSYNNPSPLEAFYSEPQMQWPGYGPKVKIKEVKADPMSKGNVMTFSNGFRVIYKKMNTSGKILWTMALNGGYGSIEDLSEGEGAFIPDYMRLCRVGGVEGSVFKDMLIEKGMTLEARVGLTATLLSGKAPKDSLERVLQVLLAISNDRTPDREAYQTYMANEELRLNLHSGGKPARLAAIDSIMCPGYKYSWMKTEGKLTAALAPKADKFFERQASKMNDGILILVSDLDEEIVKKMLVNYVGDFRTQGTAFRRPVLRYQPASGGSTYTVDGNDESIDVVMSVAKNLTMDSYMTASLAAMILQKSLSDALSRTGMYAEVAYNFQIFPQERLSVAVSVSPLAKDGFASHIDPSGSIEALEVLRAGIRDLAGTKISASVLTSCKNYLKSYLAQKMNDPQYWTDAIAKRYLDGKDFTTSYTAAIDAVNADGLMRMFSDLNTGSKVEYVVQNNK